MHGPILDYFALWPSLGYLLAFLGIVLEGDATIFIFGFLTQQQYFDPALMIITLYAGALIGDSLWYCLGLCFKYLPLSVNRWVDRLATPFDNHLTNKTLRTIFITKFAYGLHHVFILRAGSIRMNYRRLMRIDALASLPWILIIGALGYASGASFHLIRHYIHFAEILLVVAVIAFIYLERFIAKFSKRKL